MVLSQNPRVGKGHPEALKNGGGITYSRRIAAHHRIVYDIHDDDVQLFSDR